MRPKYGARATFAVCAHELGLLLARIFHTRSRKSLFRDFRRRFQTDFGADREKFSSGGTPAAERALFAGFRTHLLDSPGVIRMLLRDVNASIQPVCQEMALSRLRQRVKTSCIGKALQNCT